MILQRKMLVYWLTLVGILAGCAIGPDYAPPAMTLPVRFKQAQAWKQAQPADQEPQAPWWEAFCDAQLNALVYELHINNQTIAKTQAQYRQSLALYAEAQSTLSPVLDVTASRLRGSSYSDSRTELGNKRPMPYKLTLNASWEIDLWGKLKRAVEAGRAQVEASVADVAAARLSVQAQLVTTYLQWAVANMQQASFEQSTSCYRQQLADVYHRFNVGVAGRTDVLQAESQLKTAQAAVLDKKLQRDQLYHALATLLGKTPVELTLKPVRMLPAMPQVPLILPAALLERRADIAAAERRVALANARIGIASSAYFPNLNLSASAGYNGRHWHDWLTLPGRFWSLGPSIALTLFDGGARRALSAQAQASYDQAVANYRQVVISAFQDVEDNLAAVQALAQELSLLQHAWTAAIDSEEIAKNQYRAGTVAYLNVLIAQANRQASERRYYDVLSRHFTATVGLIRALGGSWQSAHLPVLE